MVDATKIAKLRAKAMSTAYPAEAAMFERKARELMDRHRASARAPSPKPSLRFSGAPTARSRQHQNPGLSGPPNAAR